MQKSLEMKIFYSLYMTTYYLPSTTKPSKEAYHNSLGKAVESVLIFAIFFTPSNSILSVPLHNRKQGAKTWRVAREITAMYHSMVKREVTKQLFENINKILKESFELDKDSLHWALSDPEKMAQHSIWKHRTTTNFNFKLLTWPLSKPTCLTNPHVYEIFFLLFRTLKAINFSFAYFLVVHEVR